MSVIGAISLTEDFECNGDVTTTVSLQKSRYRTSLLVNPDFGVGGTGSFALCWVSTRNNWKWLKVCMLSRVQVPRHTDAQTPKGHLWTAASIPRRSTVSRRRLPIPRVIRRRRPSLVRRGERRRRKKSYSKIATETCFFLPLPSLASRLFTGSGRTEYFRDEPSES